MPVKPATKPIILAELGDTGFDKIDPVDHRSFRHVPPDRTALSAQQRRARMIRVIRFRDALERWIIQAATSSDMFAQNLIELFALWPVNRLAIGQQLALVEAHHTATKYQTIGLQTEEQVGA